MMATVSCKISEKYNVFSFFTLFAIEFKLFKSVTWEVTFEAADTVKIMSLS